MSHFSFKFPPEIFWKKKKDNLLQKFVSLHPLKNSESRKNSHNRKTLIKASIEISTNLLYADLKKETSMNLR